MNKKLTKLLSVFLLAGAIGTGCAFTLTACGDSDDNNTNVEKPDDENKTPAVTSISIISGDEIGEIDGEMTLVAIVKVVNGADTGVIWEIVDGEDKAEIVDGKLKLKPGVRLGDTITIKATAKGDSTKYDTKVISVTVHVHDYTSAYVSDGEQGHHGICANDNAEGPVVDHNDENKDGLCDQCQYIIEHTLTFVTSRGTAPAAIKSVEHAVTEPAALADVEDGGKTYKFVGWCKDEACTQKFDFSAPLVQDGTAYANWLEVKEINNKAEFLAFIKTASPAGYYRLTADIDLAGEEVSGTATMTAKAAFDGQGHTIKNIVATPSEKKAVFFAGIDGSTIKDVKLFNCTITCTGEGPSFFAYDASDATFEKIEFSKCSVTCGGNGYGSLLFTRLKSGTARVSQITVKNNSSATVTTSKKYTGLLTADLLANTKLFVKDVQVAGKVTGDDLKTDCGFLVGRSRGADVSVENAVLDMDATSSGIGIIVGGGSDMNNGSVSVKNVLITGIGPSKTLSVRAISKLTKEKVYTVSGISITGVDNTGANTVAFLTDTLGFDFENVWETEEGGYRLKCASPNVKDASATLSQFNISTAGVKTRFEKGEDFSSDGLVVTAIWTNPDGSEFNEILTSDKYEVDYSAYDKNALTTNAPYTITVKYAADPTKSASYNVTVVQCQSVEIDTSYMRLVYKTGESLDKGHVIANAVWSDGVRDRIAGNKLTYSKNDAFTAEGGYDINISYDNLTPAVVHVNVLPTSITAVDNAYTVKVDGTHSGENGAEVGGTRVFKSIKDAINYYEIMTTSSDLNSKVIKVAAGEYRAKITTSLNNLVLIGEGEDAKDMTKALSSKSVLVYDAVEDTKDPFTNNAYGLNCASLHVKGTGFKAYNMVFSNSFDYINHDASVTGYANIQGLAFTLEADQAVLDHCYLYGNQDTLYVKSGRLYVNESRVEGNVDYIFGNEKGLMYFNKCQIHSISRYKEGQESNNNGYITAMRAEANNKPDYGYIFYQCDITGESRLKNNSQALGRPWGPKATVAFIDCKYDSKIAVGPYTDGSGQNRWADMNSHANKPTDADFVEYYGTYTNGTGIAAQVAGMTLLTEAQAANYTKANLFAATNGKCTWGAAWDCDADLAKLTTIRTAQATSAYVVAFKYKVDASSDWTACGSGSYSANSQPSKQTLIEAVQAPAGKEVDEIYTDEACTQAYVAAAITHDTTLYVTFKQASVVPGDTYSFFDSAYESRVPAGATNFSQDLTGGDTDIVVVSGKITITVPAGSGNSFKHANDWYQLRGNAKLTCTVAQGIRLNITVLNGTPVVKLDGVEVTASSSGNTATYNLSAGGNVEITAGSGYLRVLEFVNSPADNTTVSVYNSDNTATAISTWEQYNGDGITKAKLDTIRAGVTVPTGKAFDDYYVDAACTQKFVPGTTTVTAGTFDIYIGWKAARTNLTEGTIITLGTDGSYKGLMEEGIISSFEAFNRDSHTNTCQLNAGKTIVIKAMPGATVEFVWYGEAQYGTDANASVDVATDGTVTITFLAPNGTTITSGGDGLYLNSIKIIDPAVVGADIISTDQTIVFGNGSGCNYTDFETAGQLTITGNTSVNGDCVQFTGSFSFKVNKGATVAITGYPGYANYTVKVGDKAASSAQTEDYEIPTSEITADGTVIVVAYAGSGSNYIMSVQITYPNAGE